MLSLFFFILRLKGDKTVEEYKSNSHKSKENKKVEKIVRRPESKILYFNGRACASIEKSNIGRCDKWN